jgi:hypothetical protein
MEVSFFCAFKIKLRFFIANEFAPCVRSMLSLFSWKVRVLYFPLAIIIAERKYTTETKLNSVALVRKRSKPTERPPLVGEVSDNFSG